MLNVHYFLSLLADAQRASGARAEGLATLADAFALAEKHLGRYFVPDRRQLLASLRIHAAGALEYLQALPRSERGYRIFCAWSLMMGAMTIGQLDERRQSRRAETAQILARTAAIAQDNAALRRLFADLMPPLPDIAPPAPLPKPESIEWFRDTLDAPLTDAELSWLGIEVQSEAA